MNKLLRVVLGMAAIVVLLPLARAGGSDRLSEKEASGGLKEALIQGAGNAVAQLGKPDGFLGNPEVRIPLPEGMQKAEQLLRLMGKGQQVDELVDAMNRAAEAAVPQARTLLVNAVRQMSLQDAKSILMDGDDAATRYFRSKTESSLSAQFLPVVRKSTAKLQLVDQYNRLAGQAAQLGLVKAEDANVENYVTRKALDGLYRVIAEQERAIRNDPLAAAGSLAKKVFGAITR